MVILIADDEPGIRSALDLLLKSENTVILCENGIKALAEMEKRLVDLVITDFAMPKLTGIELIRRGRELSPTTAFLLMTAFGSIEHAVEAIRLGAEDYITKPFDIYDLEHRVKRIAELRSWQVERELRSENGPSHSRLVGNSPAMQGAKDFIAKVAGVPSPILLLGPSGSGKEVIAKAIHEAGERTSQSFVPINCASLSESLLESELFGHEKGAFTGATAAKPGKFELAKNGTLFLDEIGELGLTLQAKLLRVLQEKEFYRIGGVRRIQTQARVVAATHRPLKEMVAQGSFREDLYFRLNVISFEVPPLSARREDIPVLIDFFWKKMCAEFGKRLELTDEARALAESYSYPGNVRELQNVLERLIVLAGRSGYIGAASLPAEFRKSPSTGVSPTHQVGAGAKGLPEQVEEFELALIREALAQAGNNQVKAAELLKIGRPTLQYKLRKYGLLPGLRATESDAA